MKPILSSVRACLLAAVIIAMSAAAFAQIGISIRIGPPPIPVYAQPVCPSEGYLWVPGYWAYDYDYADYYWVPGTWVLAPQPGYLWTPGWWGWGGEGFIFHEGYWGPAVGFYGGIDYGFGYFGDGYVGGRWDHDRFYYNRAVTNVNVTRITNVYNTTIVHNNVSRVSYNGGEGGLGARPTPRQEAVDRERHMGPIAAQTRQLDAARGNRELRADANHGKPPIAATDRAGEFSHAEPAREAGGPYTPRNHARPGEPAAERHVPRPPNPIHPRDLPPEQRMPAPHTGNPALNQKYQEQQNKMYAKQEQQRQKLQAKQDKEHAKMQRQSANQAHQEQMQQRQQQMEQRHQQQTQHLMQKQEQQQQHQQKHEAPHGKPAPPQEAPRPH